MSDQEEKTEVSIGDQFTVLVLKGKADSLISRMKDGRVILFNRENPIFNDLEPGMIVGSRVSFIAQNYIIVDPIEPPESGIEAIKLGLQMVSETENWENAIIGRALLHIIEKLED
ncbi:hypothetical protein JW865_09695 [Candidatus Bathyarchaeota archaeon]|nr:hypothetical protein [Candidatus Bathyarchaeota archaeon]